jgi:hypothetical protein
MRSARILAKPGPVSVLQNEKRDGYEEMAGAHGRPGLPIKKTMELPKTVLIICALSCAPSSDQRCGMHFWAQSELLCGLP